MCIYIILLRIFAFSKLSMYIEVANDEEIMLGKGNVILLYFFSGRSIQKLCEIKRLCACEALSRFALFFPRKVNARIQ